jgi:hypothetical protein
VRLLSGSLLDKLSDDMLNIGQFIIKQSRCKDQDMSNVWQNSYRIGRRGVFMVLVGTYCTNRLSLDGRKKRGDLQDGHRSGCEPEG